LPFKEPSTALPSTVKFSLALPKSCPIIFTSFISAILNILKLPSATLIVISDAGVKSCILA
jgi:hypothetical protein